MIFNILAEIFKPAIDLVSKVVTKDNDKVALENQLAQIQAQVATKMMELQMAAIESNAKVAEAEQQSGNLLSKSWRPTVSVLFALNIVLMSYGVIPFNELVLQIEGAFLGIYGIGRSFEKRSK